METTYKQTEGKTRMFIYALFISSLALFLTVILIQLSLHNNPFSYTLTFLLNIITYIGVLLFFHTQSRQRINDTARTLSLSAPIFGIGGRKLNIDEITKIKDRGIQVFKKR